MTWEMLRHGAASNMSHRFLRFVATQPGANVHASDTKRKVDVEVAQRRNRKGMSHHLCAGRIRRSRSALCLPALKLFQAKHPEGSASASQSALSYKESVRESVKLAGLQLQSSQGAWWAS